MEWSLLLWAQRQCLYDTKEKFFLFHFEVLSAITSFSGTHQQLASAVRNKCPGTILLWRSGNQKPFPALGLRLLAHQPTRGKEAIEVDHILWWRQIREDQCLNNIFY